MQKVLFILSALLFITGCSVESSAGYKPNKPVIYSDGLIIDGITYEKTGEVLVIDKEVTIEGEFERGAFVQGTTVTIKPFYMCKYEVTQELYKIVMEKDNEYDLDTIPSACNPETICKNEKIKLRPVDATTWYDDVYFCNKLSDIMGLEKVYNISNIRVETEPAPVKQTGKHIVDATVTINDTANGYRLPYIREWEFAARGGDTTKPDWYYKYSGSDDANLVGWNIFNICEDSLGEEPTKDMIGYGTHEVGLKLPNALGIFDMTGNVWDRCYDESDIKSDWGNRYNLARFSRIIYGGSWKLGPWEVFRQNNGSHPSGRDCYMGFRLCRSYISHN